jgi:hypothetical protein
MHLVLPVSDSVLSPNIFDSDYLVQQLDNVYNLLPSNSWDQQQTKEVLLGIMKQIEATKVKDSVKQQELIKYLDEIDRRRSLDWRQCFPWLPTEVERVV